MGREIIGKYIDFDADKVDQIIATHKLTEKEFSESLGHTGGYYRHSKERGTLKSTDYLLIKTMYGVDVKKEEPKKEVDTTDSNIDLDSLTQSLHTDTKKIISALESKNNDDVVKKMDEMLVAINKLGNVQMQILEELHKTNSHLLKANGRPIARI